MFIYSTPHLQEKCFRIQFEQRETSMKLFGSGLYSILIAAAVAAMPLGASAKTVRFTADLTASSVVPATDSQGKGTLTASLNTDTNVLTYRVTYSGLSGPVTAAHFHGPAAEGANAGPQVPIKAPLTSPIRGTATLTADQEKDLQNGMWYVNLHTAANKGGEIRGQVKPAGMPGM
jgi:hypothetical protein